MIVTPNNVTLRNLYEQVLDNKEQIAKHWNVDRILADFGIKMLGRFDSYDDIKDLDEGENYGNAYLVGTEEPYDVYVWTRADVNAGQPVPYWLDIGPISLVGPQGPQGEKGDKGDTGNSTRWYGGPSIPNADTIPNAQPGDMYTTSTGSIYECYETTSTASGINWKYVGTIRGPQGIQGIQGVQGPAGPEGPQGPQGERGDVGGFINIWGILTQSSQLPAPASLNNLTVAYLIGSSAPYDLWVQVGESTTTAIWKNTGPFNAATAVSSNGVYQNVWDADTKLDKYTNVTEYNQVYVKAADGSEGTINVTKSALADAVVQRNSTGTITSVYPNTDSDVTTKSYVKADFVARDKTSSNIVYGKEGGVEKVYDVSQGVTPNTIARRTDYGGIRCVTQYQNDATTKDFVEENFVAKSTETLKIYGTDSQGNQTTWNFRNTNNTKNTVAGRDDNGNIQVGTAVNPTDAVNKQFAEGNFVTKITGTTSLQQVYTKAPNGTQTMANMSSSTVGSSIVQRQPDSNIQVPVTPAADSDATSKVYVDNLFVQARFNFSAGSNYVLINLYMKKSDYDTINSIETLSAYLNGKGATSAANPVIIHMGERSTDVNITDILQYIYAPTATRFTLVGFSRSSGSSVFIESSTLTYTSKAYVSL